MNSTIRSNVSGPKKGIQIEPVIKDSEIQSEYLVQSRSPKKVDII